MNNKQIGMQFEREMRDYLAKEGYWVHFIAPDVTGAQPFDLIFAKDGVANVADCKTCVAKTFTIDRLEDNQILAFEKWVRCGNADPVIFVKHDNIVHKIPYKMLKFFKKIKLEERSPYCILSQEIN